MGQNRAFLIGNSVTYRDTTRDVTKAIVQSVLAELQDKLKTLDEEFRFEVKHVTDAPKADAASALRQSIKAAGQSNSTFLLYYFGHGMRRPADDQLFLYFKDSDQYDFHTMLRLAEVIEWLRDYKVPRCILILDCCFAGMLAKQLTELDHYNQNTI